MDSQTDITEFNDFGDFEYRDSNDDNDQSKLLSTNSIDNLIESNGAVQTDDTVEEPVKPRKRGRPPSKDKTPQIKAQKEADKTPSSAKGEKSKTMFRASVKETGSESIRYYLKSMGNHELLGKNEEIVLGKHIQILIKWELTREELEAKLMR